ncbi:glucose-6-phosphate isomerase [candidate division KSB1 bacterium]|nr:glucose-6-phosphate isomerase [candidate division KSB1 bacterium]
MIHLDDGFLREIISAKKLETIRPRLERAAQQVNRGECAGNDFLGWRDLPIDPDRVEIERIKQEAQRIRTEVDRFVVIGIGGSYLGARAAIEFLIPPFSQPQPQMLYFGHHLGSDYGAGFLELLDSGTTCINVISKSGTTTEPAIAFRLALDRLNRRSDAKTLKKRIIATTDPRHGHLRRLAEAQGWTTFAIPPDVGGRFSVLTPVGLLPIAVAGFDIDALLAGARDMALLCQESMDPGKNPALRYAALRTLLYESGKHVEILSTFDPALHYMAEWWKQLFGESEGKDGKGLFPASAHLTTDLHSLGQYIQDGSRILFETFLWLEETRETLVIPESTQDADDLNYLAGRSLDAVNYQAYRGTALAHSDGGVPVITLGLKRRDEYTLGALYYFFEYTVAISGLLLGVNPFDQPGVEAYKKNMFALLGKPGYEEEQKRLEKRLDRSIADF